MIELLLYAAGFLWWYQFRKVPYFQDRAVNAVISDLWFDGKGVLYKDIGVTYMPVGIYVFYGLVRKYISKEATALNLLAGAFFAIAPVMAYKTTMAIGGNGLLASIITLLMMSNLRFIGTTANYENFSTVIVLILFYFLVVVKGLSGWYFLGAGTIYGVLLLVKQVHILLLPIWLIWLPFYASLYGVIFFLAGSLWPNLFVWYLFHKKGGGADYVRWNWQKPFATINVFKPKNEQRLEIIYSSTRTQAFKNKLPRIVDCLETLIPFLLPAVIWSVFAFESPWHSLRVMIALCGAAAMFMVTLGGSFRPQYWLNVIPWMAIACALFWSDIIHLSPNAKSFSQFNQILLFSISSFIILSSLFVVRDWRFIFPDKDPYKYLDGYYENNLFREVKTAAAEFEPPDPGKNKLLVFGHLPEFFLFTEWQPYSTSLMIATAKDFLKFFEACPSMFLIPPDRIFWGGENDSKLNRRFEKLWNCKLMTDAIYPCGTTWRTVLESDYEHERLLGQQTVVDSKGDNTIIYVSRPVDKEFSKHLLNEIADWVGMQSSWKLKVRPHPVENAGIFSSVADERPATIVIDNTVNLLESLKQNIVLCVSPFSRAALYAASMGIPVWLVPTGEGDFEIDHNTMPDVRIVCVEKISAALSEWSQKKASIHSAMQVRLDMEIR